MRILGFAFSALLGVFILTRTLHAQVPMTLSYQGLLSDTLGQPKADGTYSIMFRLYSSSSGGTALWSEGKSLQVSHGLFTTSLGDQTPINLPFTEQYWLGITVGADPELQPRVSMNSAGYSFRSLASDSARVAGSVPDGTIGAAKIAVHQVVKSVNGLTDVVTLRATGGASISSVGDTLVINAGSGGGSSGIQALQSSNGTINISNPNGPTSTVNVKDQGISTAQLANASVTLDKISTAGATSGKVLKFDGSNLTWSTDENGSLALPFTGTTNSFNPALQVTNTGGGKGASFSISNSTSTNNAVEGITDGGGAGVFGQSPKYIGVVGSSTNGNGVVGTSDNGYGVLGAGGSAGVNGNGSTVGVRGAASATSGQTKGVYGIASSITGVGVFGLNTTAGGVAVHGENNSGFGVSGFGNTGVFGSGQNSNSAIGVLGIANGLGAISVEGTGDNYGIWGQGANIGVYAHNVGGASAGRDAYLATQSLAADLYGNVYVHGTVTQGSTAIRIDNPTDPANKYLYHAAVESPEMKNIYDGVATLDASGKATVTLPSWFDALNKDFRYQLTAIGAPGPNLYIAQKISGNIFVIAGGVPGSEVSWQVTGIRQDAWAKAHPIAVEEDKPVAERGFYEHPELYGQPENKSILHALHPDTQSMAAEQEKTQAILKTTSSSASGTHAEGGR